MGIGVIEGVECVILGHDPSVRAGAFNPFNGKKLMRGLEIARENRMPYVQFVESAGADLRGQGGGDGSDPNKVAEAAIQRDLDHFAESGRLFTRYPNCRKCAYPLCRSCLVLPPQVVLINRHERLQHYGKKPSHGVFGRPAAGEDGHRRRR